MERIITIGREYGSGGREIGRRLAEKLQFAFFDYQIVTELAKRTAFAEEYILSIQEKRPYPVLPVPTVRMWAPPNPMLDQHLEVFLKESEVIRDMADKAPCVIVGRCADYVLRHRNPLRLFFYADIADRMERLIGEQWRSRPIGSQIALGEVWRTVRETPNVRLVRQVLVEGTYDQGGQTRIIPLENRTELPFAVVRSGSHLVRVR